MVDHRDAHMVCGADHRACNGLVENNRDGIRVSEPERTPLTAHETDPPLPSTCLPNSARVRALAPVHDIEASHKIAWDEAHDAYFAEYRNALPFGVDTEEFRAAIKKAKITFAAAIYLADAIRERGYKATE